MATESVPALGQDLLQSATRVVADADSRDGIADGVCRAAADAGYLFAAFVEDDLVRAAAGVDPRRVERALDAIDGREPEIAATEDDEVVVRTRPAGETTAGGASALVGVPLTHDGTTFGALVLGTDDRPGPDDRTTLADVGTAVAHGLAAQRGSARRERIEREYREHQRKVEQLHSVAAGMVGRESVQEILEMAIDAAQNILKFDICGIDLFEDGYLVPRATSSGLPEDGARKVSVEEGIAGKTFRNGTSYLFDDVRKVEEAVPAQSGYRSVISVPIDDVGVFQAGSEEASAFTDDDVELAELLMSYVAATVKRCQSEAALRESEEQYRTVVEGSHDAVFVYGEDGVRFVNDRACELTGYDRTELVGGRALDVVHPEDRGALAGELADADDVVDLAPASFTARVGRPDGEVRHCEFRLTAIVHDGEDAVLGSVRDVTERVEQRRQLQRQNERLEEFASILSHDLRNPLNVAQGSLDLARNTGDEDHLERAERALDRMETLVGNVLDLARKGRVVDDPEEVGLGAVVADAWSQVDCPDASLDVPFEEFVVEADPDRLQTLLENLFRNAVEHGSTSNRPKADDAVEHGGPAVTVTVGRLDGAADVDGSAGEDAALGGFYVADDGPGIPPGEREQVFERGYTTEESGTGFGLAIVRNVAEAHGWEISVADSDEGARFEVTRVRTP